MSNAFGVVHKSENGKKTAEAAGYGTALAGAAGVVGAKDLRNAIVQPQLKKLKRQRKKWEKSAPKTYYRAQGARLMSSYARADQHKALEAIKANPVAEGQKPTKEQKKAQQTAERAGAKADKYKAKAARISMKSINTQRYLTLKPQQVKRLTTTKVGAAAAATGLVGLAAGEAARRSRRQPKPQPIEKRSGWWT